MRGQVSAGLPPPSSYGYAKAHMVQYSVGESRTRACPPTCPSLAFTFLAKPRSLDKNALWLATRVPLTCCAGGPARATARAAPMAPPQDVRHPPSTRGVTNADKSTLVAPFPRVHLVGTVLRPAPELSAARRTHRPCRSATSPPPSGPQSGPGWKKRRRDLATSGCTHTHGARRGCLAPV